jgi:peptidoglycan lytic transglycosylase G
MMERPRVLKTTSSVARAGPGLPVRGFLHAALALLGVFVCLQIWWLTTAAHGVMKGPRIVEIPPQQGLLDIARRLDEAGVIRSPFGFALLALAQGSARSLKAGEYQVPQGANTFAVLSLLEAGKVLKHTVLLREGFTLAELAHAVEAEGLAPSDDVLRVGHDPLFLRTLEIPGSSVEGYLFPDSYQFVKGVPPEEILARMVMKMRAQLTPDILKAAEARGLSAHQLLTLASIIEREGVERSELPLISAVFWNRLKRDMPLQADPTVQYAVGKGRQALTRADLQVDHPFNTYRRVGLPPAPIANPGLPAIYAAAHPARANYLYFVALDDRHHQFSESLAAHNDAVARYRLSRSR